MLLKILKTNINIERELRKSVEPVWTLRRMRQPLFNSACNVENCKRKLKRMLN